MLTTPQHKKQLIDEINNHRKGKYQVKPGLFNIIDLHSHDRVIEFNLANYESFPEIVRSMDNTHDTIE